jgi:hypothetical protein
MARRRPGRRTAHLVELLVDAIEKAEERLDRLPEAHPAAIHIRSRQQGLRQLLFDLLDIRGTRGLYDAPRMTDVDDSSANWPREQHLGGPR